MASVTNYTGNAGLGQGSNADIDVYGGTGREFDVINDTAKTIMLMDHEKQLKQWQEKVNERNKLYDMINKDEIVVEKALEEDRPIIQSLKEDVNQARRELVQAQAKGDGDNNRTAVNEAMIKYQQKQNRLAEAAKHAQLRYVDVTSERDNIKKSTLSKEREAREKNLNDYMSKGFYADFTPYQQAYKFDAGTLRAAQYGDNLWVSDKGAGAPMQNADPKKVVTKVDPKGGTTTTTTVQTGTTPAAAGASSSGKKGVGKSVISVTTKEEIDPLTMSPVSVTEKRIDYNNIYQNTLGLFSQGQEEYEGMRVLYDNINQLPTAQKRAYIEKANTRIAEYNKQNEFTPLLPDGTPNPNYVKPIRTISNSTEKDPDAVYLAESVPEFAAKEALAGIAGNYKVKEMEINKDLASYQNEKRKVDAEVWLKRVQGNSSARRTDAYVSNVRSQIKARDNKDAEKFVSTTYNQNISSQKQLVVPHKKGAALALIDSKNSTPLFTFGTDGKPTLLQPIGGQPVYDKVGKDGKPTDKSRQTGWSGGHYRQIYVRDGKPVSLQDLHNAYNVFLSDVKSRNKVWNGGFNEFLQKAVGTTYEVWLEGENGRTSPDITRSIFLKNKVHDEQEATAPPED
jgi:hypothetical protein